jgi:secreted PhoX family phosphatase
MMHHCGTNAVQIAEKGKEVIQDEQSKDENGGEMQAMQNAEMQAPGGKAGRLRILLFGGLPCDPTRGNDMGRRRVAGFGRPR